jgi:hypothetical protein
MTEFTKVEPGVWKPAKAGDNIEGVLVSIGDSKKYGGKIYHIETPKGEQLVVFGSTVLDDRMSYIKIGEYCKIEFNGTTKNAKNQDTKMFAVYKAKPKV